MLNEDIIDTLVRTAINASENAYTERSHFAVGSCALASDGTLYSGCNIDNASPSLSCCAEAVAIYRAVADGKREFDAVAVVADTEDPFIPCGACCQLMAEFKVKEVIMANMNGDMNVVPLEDLLPYADRLLSNHSTMIDF